MKSHAYVRCIALSFYSLLVGCADTEWPEPTQRPNLLLIAIDDLNDSIEQ